MTTIPAAPSSRTWRPDGGACGVDLDAVADERRPTPRSTASASASLASARRSSRRRGRRSGPALPSSSGAASPRRSAAPWSSGSGELLAEHKDDLATLISLEVGKITSEARGEVQEMVDICDFAVGLSRQLYGRTMPSERPGHRLMETWHPLGVVGVISAFNFPAAVWSWNTAIALVCGDPVVWKPSELTPLTSLACQALLARAIAEAGAPADLSQVLIGGAEAGEALVDAPRRRAAERHRVDPDGPGRGPAGRGALRPRRCSSSAATTPPSSAPARTST